MLVGEFDIRRPQGTSRRIIIFPSPILTVISLFSFQSSFSFPVSLVRFICSCYRTIFDPFQLSHCLILAVHSSHLCNSSQYQSCKMKTFAIAVAGGLATVASASPYYAQGAQPVTTECAAKTVTVTETYAAGYTNPPAVYSPAPEQYTQGNGYTQGTALPPNYGSYTGTSAIYATTTTSSAPGAHCTHKVDVGTFNGTVQFIPNTINAAIGDIIEYNFLAKSHSLTQSEFLTPCTYNGGFDTGLNQVNPKNQSGLFVIPFEVKTTRPQWFYCKQQGPPNHCGAGMVFGLNPRSEAQMGQFIANAKAQNGNLTGVASSTLATAAPTATTTTYSSTGTGIAAAIPTVTVGLGNGKTLRFDPPYLPYVPAGSKIHFDFRAANHTLTESSLADPCTKLTTPSAIDTGFSNFNPMDVPGLKSFELEVTGSESRYFYCKQANKTPKSHCGKGMVFGLNVDEATFRQFEANALATLPVVKRRAFRA